MEQLTKTFPIRVNLNLWYLFGKACKKEGDRRYKEGKSKKKHLHKLTKIIELIEGYIEEEDMR